MKRAFLALVLVAGCGGHPLNNGGPQSYSVEFGPINVPAGTERTQCVIKRLGNPNMMHVGTIHNTLGNASHHMIVYRVNDTMEQTTPFDCQPFVDTLDPSKGAPLMITQKKDEVLALPAGVAYTLDANQMLRLEMHYINATPMDVTLDSKSTLTSILDSAYKYEGDFLFIGDPDINIPAMSKATVGPVFFPLPSDYQGVNFFALTGHEHHWGTNVQVWTAGMKGDPAAKPVYEIPNWQWSDPVTAFQDPPFQIPSGGGFQFQCDWDNQSTAPVKFGESANNEMCFFWAYYYPSKGARVCAHSDKYNIDLCCPGSPYCAFLSGSGM